MWDRVFPAITEPFLGPDHLPHGGFPHAPQANTRQARHQAWSRGTSPAGDDHDLTNPRGLRPLTTGPVAGGTVQVVRKKLIEWSRRYLPCEIAGTVGELGGAAVAYVLTGSTAAAAVTATVGASVGYYAAAYPHRDAVGLSCAPRPDAGCAAGGRKPHRVAQRGDRIRSRRTDRQPAGAAGGFLCRTADLRQRRGGLDLRKAGVRRGVLRIRHLQLERFNGPSCPVGRRKRRWIR